MRAIVIDLRTLAREWRSWDLAVLFVALAIAVAALTGDDDPAMVNPDFPGYWREMPPPASCTYVMAASQYLPGM